MDTSSRFFIKPSGNVVTSNKLLAEMELLFVTIYFSMWSSLLTKLTHMERFAIGCWGSPNTGFTLLPSMFFTLSKLQSSRHIAKKLE